MTTPPTVAVLPGDDAAPEAVHAAMTVLHAMELPIQWRILPDGHELAQTMSREEGETLERQRRQHRVSYGAARLDLLELERRGLLERAKVGKKFVFRPAPDLPDRLSSATR